MDRRNASSLIANGPAIQTKCNRWIYALPAIGAVMFLVSCAGTPPKDAMSQAELAVSHATETKAPQLAPLELRKARDHLDQAKQAMQDKDYTAARRLAENAMVEAELAEAKTGAEDAQANVAKLQQSLKTTQEKTAPR
jgi:hypothetical protein